VSAAVPSGRLALGGVHAPRSVNTPSPSAPSPHSTRSPKVVAAYNLSRKVQNALAAAGAPVEAVARLLAVRHTACAALLVLARPDDSAACVEAAQCWIRTANSWRTLPASSLQAHAAFLGVLASHRAMGGLHAVNRLLDGSTREAHLEVVFEALLGAAGLEWDAAVEAGGATASVFLRASFSERPYVRPAAAAGGAPSQTVDARALESHARSLLVRDAAALLPSLPHHRLRLARLLGSRGRELLNVEESARCIPWYAGALELLPTTTGGSVEGVTKLRTVMLLSMAAAEINESRTAASVSPGGGSQAADRAQAHLQAASAEGDIVGRHLLVKLAGLRGDVEGGAAHLAALTSLLSASLCGGQEGAPPACVPLGRSGLGADLLVHPSFPLVASACRAYAMSRRFDDGAMNAYVAAGGAFKSKRTERVLLLHDLLTGMLQVLRPPAPSGPIPPAPPVHEVVATKSVAFVLATIVKQHTVEERLPQHVRETVVTLLHGGMRSAFEAQAWQAADKCATALVSLAQGDGPQGGSGLGRAELAGVRRVMAFAALHGGAPSDALPHARAAQVLLDGSAARLLVLRVLCAMPAPTGAAAGGQPDVAALVVTAEAAGETEEGCDVTTLSGYTSALARAFAAFLRTPDFAPGYLLVALDTLNGSGSALAEQGAGTRQALAAIALSRLLLSSKASGWDTSASVPGLGTVAVVRQLVALHRGLRTEASGEQAVAARAELRLVSACLERIKACRKSMAPAAAREAILATCGDAAGLAWCLRVAFRALASAHEHGDVLGCLAGAMTVNAFAVTASDVAQTGGGRALAYNLALVTRATALIQAFTHLQLAQSATAIAGPGGRYIADPVAAAMSASCVGPDLTAGLTLMAPGTHLTAAATAIATVRASYEDAALGAGAPSPAEGSSEEAALGDVAQQAAHMAGAALHGFGAGALPRTVSGGDNEGEVWQAGTAPSPSSLASLASDGAALASALSTLSFHGQVLSIAPEGGKLPQTAADGLSAALAALTAQPGMTPYLLEHASQVLAGQPCNDAALARTALQAALGLTLAPLAAGRSGVDYAHASSLLRRIISLAPTRKVALPSLDTALSLAVKSAEAADSAAVSGGRRPTLFPSVALDGLVAIAWNHGVFLHRCASRTLSAQFMAWTLRACPLVLRLEAHERGDATVSARLGTACEQAVKAACGERGLFASAEAEDPRAALALARVVEATLAGPTAVSTSRLVSASTTALELPTMRKAYESLYGASRAADHAAGDLGMGTAIERALFAVPPARAALSPAPRVGGAKAGRSPPLADEDEGMGAIKVAALVGPDGPVPARGVPLPITPAMATPAAAMAVDAPAAKVTAEDVPAEAVADEMLL